MRDNGFYWVKQKTRSYWTIAEYFHGWFDIVGEEVSVRKEDLDEIGDKIEVPGKYK